MVFRPQRCWHSLCFAFFGVGRSGKEVGMRSPEADIAPAQFAVGAGPPSPPPRSLPSSGLLLVEGHALVGGPPMLFAALTPHERELVIGQGRRRVLNRGQTLFRQGAPHEGIYLVESGRIRVFYEAPSGRE